jgi:hypothetical protein
MVAQAVSLATDALQSGGRRVSRVLAKAALSSLMVAALQKPARFSSRPKRFQRQRGGYMSRLA